MLTDHDPLPQWFFAPRTTQFDEVEDGVAPLLEKADHRIVVRMHVVVRRTSAKATREFFRPAI